jgi:uncharacterized protein (DUF2267 family)
MATPQPSAEAHFIERVRELTGLEDDASAQRAASAVTSVLFEQLSPHDRAWLATQLPLHLTETPGPMRPAEGARDFYERIARREGAELGFAVEHAQAICRALDEQLGDEAQLRMTKLLPVELVELFEARAEEHAARSAAHGQAHAARRTLSEGRPTSRRPLSEAAPAGAPADSVARAGNPHADTKVSSSPGTTQEREHETLAEGGRKRRRDTN